MSAFCPSADIVGMTGMSAFGGESDIAFDGRNVRLCPKRTSPGIGSREHEQYCAFRQSNSLQMEFVCETARHAPQRHVVEP
jgi:hypothetical protein